MYQITEPKSEAFSSHTSTLDHGDTSLVFGQLRQLLIQFFNCPDGNNLHVSGSIHPSSITG